MDKLECIKMALNNDLEYWEKREKENPDSSYYRGNSSKFESIERKN